MERENCIVCGAEVDEGGLALKLTPALIDPGRDLAAEALAIARGDLRIRPEREHVVELVRLLELRQAAIVQILGATAPELHS